MIRDLTHNMKETKQGTMALVGCHSDLYTMVQEKSESLEAHHKVFIARKDTVNARGGEAGRHKQLHRLARQKIMDELGLDEAYMEDPTNLAAKHEIEK